MSRVNESLEAEKPIQTAGEICRDFLAQKLGLVDIYMMLPFVKNITLSKKCKTMQTAVSLWFLQQQQQQQQSLLFTPFLTISITIFKGIKIYKEGGKKAKHYHLKVSRG